MESTHKHVRAALLVTTEAVKGSALTRLQEVDLLEQFGKAKGTPRKRARKAIREVLGITEFEIDAFRVSSDNADRLISNLENVLRIWEPRK